MADLHKHLVLLAVLLAMRQKETPFGVVDAFAGEGMYDLRTPEAQKIREYETGYELVRTWDHPLVERLTALEKALSAQLGGPAYPGSPAIIADLLRPQDNAIFIENHPQAFEVLSTLFGKHPGITVERQDAYKALPKMLPLRQPRGVVFIDPSYEVKEEYAVLPPLLARALQKYRQGVYIVWYPLLAEARHLPMEEALGALPTPNIWKSTWHMKNPTRMLGSGVMVFNLPYAAETSLASLRDVHI